MKNILKKIPKRLGACRTAQIREPSIGDGEIQLLECLRLLFVQRSYPEIFFKLRENITCYLLSQNSKFEQFSPFKNLVNFKGFDREIINFKNKRTSHPEILIKVDR